MIEFTHQEGHPAGRAPTKDNLLVFYYPRALGWMKGETARYFTDRDWELVGQALQSALDDAPDGETREWSNEKSGARGSMTPVTTEMHGDVTCRRLRIESMARGSSSSGAYLFCRRGDGAWGFGRPEG